MDLQRFRSLKTSVKAFKIYMKSLTLPSRQLFTRTHNAITKCKTLKQNFYENEQQLLRFNKIGRSLFIISLRNIVIQKRRVHSILSRYNFDTIAFKNNNLLGHKSSKTYFLPSKEYSPVTKNDSFDRRQILVFNKTIFVRHYSSLNPKIERWRGTDKRDRKKLAKLVDCVSGKNSCGGGGFFKSLFGKFFGSKENTSPSCNNCKQSPAEKKVDEAKDDCDVSKVEDECDVKTDSGKASKMMNFMRKGSKTEDKCDEKPIKPTKNKKRLSKAVCIQTEGTGLCSKKEESTCGKTLSKAVCNKTEESAPTCGKSDQSPKISCNVNSQTDRLKQLDTLEKCICTLQLLIRNLKLEEEMKRAAEKEPTCSESKKPVCPEPQTSICPEPKTSVCPEPQSSVCPEPVKLVCPKPNMPVCPEYKKPTCPEPLCPEPKKPPCPEPKKPICAEDEPYKCGIIEDRTPFSKSQGKQQCMNKKQKQSPCGNNLCGRETSKDVMDRCSKGNRKKC